MIELVDVRLDHPRGGEPLVADANLTVSRGEVVMIVGAAGAGTSRLVAAALGELPANGGRIEVMGRDLAKLRRSSLRRMRRRIGVVPQDLLLLEDRSVETNVTLPLEIDGISRPLTVGRATTLLEKLGLGPAQHARVDTLSGAERQRVAVARALIRDPELVFADHPTSMQDATGAELVGAALGDAADAGAAVLVLGRDPALRAIAEARGWRTLVLLDGRLRTQAELALTEAAIDALLGGIDTPVEAAPADELEDNVVPFPLSARTAGVA
ncbi:MAG: ATP-binding cassette domain-containing protein [Kofleriaceae bacterium]|nr:ATP-binding cassette domain-containing protein [Kofleriaceae bacterium]